MNFWSMLLDFCSLPASLNAYGQRWGLGEGSTLGSGELLEIFATCLAILRLLYLWPFSPFTDNIAPGGGKGGKGGTGERSGELGRSDSGK